MPAPDRTPLRWTFHILESIHGTILLGSILKYIDIYTCSVCFQLYLEAATPGFEVASVINLSQVLRACFKFTLPSLIDTLGTGILVARAALAFSKAGRYVRRRHNRLTGWSDQFSRQYSEKFFCEKCANFLGFLCKESFRDSPVKSSGKWRAASYFKGKALTFASVVERIFHITGLLPDKKNKVGNFKPSDSQRSEIFMNKG